MGNLQEVNFDCGFKGQEVQNQVAVSSACCIHSDMCSPERCKVQTHFVKTHLAPEKLDSGKRHQSLCDGWDSVIQTPSTSPHLSTLHIEVLSFKKGFSGGRAYLNSCGLAVLTIAFVTSPHGQLVPMPSRVPTPCLRDGMESQSKPASLLT